MTSLHTQRRQQQQQQHHDQRQRQQQHHQIRRGHRRGHRRRRRFRYRKEALWLILSLLILLFLAIPYGINTSTINDQDYHRDFAIFVSIIIAVFIAIIRIWKKLSCYYNNRLVTLSLPTVSSSSSSSSTTFSWKTILLSPIYFSFRIKNFLLRWWSRMVDIYRGTSNNILYIAETATSVTYPIRTTMTITETLENFNQERLIRGESTVSTESIIAYERFMRDLADAVVVATTSSTAGNNNLIINSGVKKEQIEELCPRWTILSTTATTHHNCLMQTECGICLDGFEEEQEEGVVYADNKNDGKDDNKNHQGRNNTFVRTLPCRHIYHSRCIDQWFQRSKFCPTCKRSVLLPPLPPPPTSTSTSITSC